MANRVPDSDDCDVSTLPSEEEHANDVHLHTAMGHEVERLTSHPVREIERLAAEARSGRAAATPLIVVAGAALVAWLVAAAIVGASLLAAWLATR
jgi:hypothetical protein